MKKVCVLTGSRAEYGLLRWVIHGLHLSKSCELQLVVTGMHLSREFGETWKEIVNDGFEVSWKVDMLLGSDSTVGITKSMGLGMVGFADAFEQLKPDLVVILGDRFEMFPAAAAAMIAGCTIAHLHGGELTEGLYDDPIRHAITKMSHLHFTAAEPYRNRVIQMGEHPDRVWCVGGFGIDGVMKLDRMTRSELEESLGISLCETSLMVTFHPETATGVDPRAQMAELLAALDESHAQLIFTMPNADTDGRALFPLIEDFVARHPGRACAHASLGQRRYLSALDQVDAVVGNSSSGLIEAPAFGKGTVNIGARQDGRLRAASVVDCVAERGAILQAITKVLNPDFLEEIQGQSNPYGDGGASLRTVAAIEDWLVNTGASAPKIFHDLPRMVEVS